MKNLSMLLIFLSLTLGCSGTQHKGPVSDHFDGQRFYNPWGVNVDKGLFELLKWRFTGERKQWPQWVKIDQQTVPSKRVEKGEISVTFINHATVLLQIDGKNLLFDPVWSQRVSPFTWIGPKRVKKPGIKIEDMPPIDMILISHNHYDHMDLKTLQYFMKRDNPKLVVGLGSQTYLDEIAKADELDWYQSINLDGLKITFTPCQHWSKRGLFDRNKSLWGAFVVEGSKKVYFGGDSGYGPHFKEAYKKFGAFDLAFLPIGAYEPRWFMKQQHINPQEAIQAHVDLKSKQSIGIHFGTFQLTDEGIDEPENDLLKQMEIMGLGKNEFIVPKNGQSFKIMH
ncbi:MBL fold metallo-hydrolase [Bacteriovorax sp. DB6_IX]|uniref:MBL fold metallo-hydrolase n=1 Tax=Bacteriovorax sp. DB6_IX TaxID=1353530 RepID=UPI000389E8BF|nr:MBL fold metallo-hydrolase [Bacteriovorax sp. DB6_IX]EQC52502.1 beta-lactamase family protein [Bacteriovorax sp. DB6_IX]